MRMPIVYIIVGIMLIGNFLVMTTVSNLHFGLVLSLVIGCYLLGWGVLQKKHPEGKVFRVFRWIHRLFLAGIAYLLIVSLFLGIYGNRDTVDYQEDALIVLGAAVHGETVSLPLKFRLDCAIEYAEKNPDAVIVVSGGQGNQEDITEALAMERYLIQNGVTNLIVKEERATSTYENFLYSKKILEKLFGEEYRVAFVTNDFHIYRSEQMSDQVEFPTVTHLHGKTAWYNVVHNYLRESLAVTKLWILGI